MNRRLPNSSNRFLGHSSAIPREFVEDPRTVRRTMLRGGEIHLISEAQMAHETSNSWKAARAAWMQSTTAGIMRSLLDEGCRIATLQAVYERVAG